MPVYRIPVEFTYPNSGGPGVNVWHARTDGVLTTDVQSAVDAIHSFYDSLKAYFATGWAATLGVVTDVATQEGQSPSWATVTSTAATGTVPPALAICVTWKSTSVSRRGTGRTFLGTLNNVTLQTDGTITDSVRTAITTAANTLITASKVDNGWALGVWGQQNPGVPAAKVLRDFNSVLVKDKFAVMRSRRD